MKITHLFTATIIAAVTVITPNMSHASDHQSKWLSSVAIDHQFASGNCFVIEEPNGRVYYICEDPVDG